MDPVSALGVTASVFSLLGVAVQIVHSLDMLKSKWTEVSLKIVTLQTQVRIFRSAFEELHKWMKSGSWYRDTSSSFIESLDLSLEGCTRLLTALQQKVQALSEDPERPSARDKAMLLWTESGIKDISDSLHCQASGLQLLLQCRTLSQHDKLFSSEENQTIISRMSDNTSLLRQIQEARNSEDKRDTDSLSELLQGDDEASEHDLVDSAIWAKTLQLQLDRTQLLSSLPSAQKKSPKVQSSNVSIAEKAGDRQEEVEIQAPLVNVQSRDSLDNFSKSALSFGKLSKFRILIIGQSGVGKSTLCSKILGISEEEAGVSDRTVGTHTRKVWEEMTFPGQNENLILHDSGGFEAASEASMREISSFIKFRRDQTKLEEQLHCIWYCISCSTRRLIQQAEKYFFEQIDTGPVPVIIVFTQYDTRIKEHHYEWMEGPNAELQLPQQGRKIAAENAFADYDQNYKGAVLKLVRKGLRVSTCRVGFSRGAEISSAKHGDSDLVGISALVDETLSRLNSGHLRLIWMVVQRHRVDYLMQASVERCIDLFWSSNKYHIIPVTVVGLLFNDAFEKIMSTLNDIWKIKTNKQRILDADNSSFLEAILGTSKNKAALDRTTQLMYSFLWPLSGPMTAKAILTILIGCALLFERISWKQQEKGGNTPIDHHTVTKVLRELEFSLDMMRVQHEIESRVKLSNCYSKVAAKSIAQSALEAIKSKKPIASLSSKGAAIVYGHILTKSQPQWHGEKFPLALGLLRSHD